MCKLADFNSQWISKEISSRKTKLGLSLISLPQEIQNICDTAVSWRHWRELKWRLLWEDMWQVWLSTLNGLNSIWRSFLNGQVQGALFSMLEKSGRASSTTLFLQHAFIHFRNGANIPFVFSAWNIPSKYSEQLQAKLMNPRSYRLFMTIKAQPSTGSHTYIQSTNTPFGGVLKKGQVRSCLLITLIKCLKGHKSLRALYGSVFQQWWGGSQSDSQSVSDKVTYWAVWGQLWMLQNNIWIYS